VLNSSSYRRWFHERSDRQASTQMFTVPLPALTLARISRNNGMVRHV